MEKMFYTPTEVSKLLGVRPQTVYMLLEMGKLPALKFSTRWRIPIDQFHEWVNNECWTQTMERGQMNV